MPPLAAAPIAAGAAAGAGTAAGAGAAGAGAAGAAGAGAAGAGAAGSGLAAGGAGAAGAGAGAAGMAAPAGISGSAMADAYPGPAGLTAGQSTLMNTGSAPPSLISKMGKFIQSPQMGQDLSNANQGMQLMGSIKNMIMPKGHSGAPPQINPPHGGGVSAPPLVSNQPMVQRGRGGVGGQPNLQQLMQLLAMMKR